MSNLNASKIKSPLSTFRLTNIWKKCRELKKLKKDRTNISKKILMKN